MTTPQMAYNRDLFQMAMNDRMAKRQNENWQDNMRRQQMTRDR